MKAHLLPAVLFLATSAASYAQVAASAPSAKDWLIDPAPFKARIIEDKARTRLILDNGLARRVILLGPNAATVSFGDSAGTHELIRTPGPEARLTLDGTEYPIGGLGGVKNNSYLSPDWALAPLPGAYRYAGWCEEPVRERFSWQKKPEWMAKDLPWPPPGKHIVMRYDPPAVPPTALSGQVVAEHDFLKAKAAEWGSGWKILKAEGFDRASFVNEGKVGEVMAWNASAVCAETAWPKNARSAEVVIRCGDDNNDVWGPGLCVVSGGQAFNFVASPQTGTFRSAGGSGGKLDRSRPVRLRVRHADGQLFFEASQADAPFITVGSVGCPKQPNLLRVGKPGLNGTGQDAGGDHGVTCVRVESVVFRGAEPPTRPIARADLPQVEVHYELYDGIPLLQKWLVVKNTSGKKIRVNRFTAEELHLVQPGFSIEEGKPIPPDRLRYLYVETDMTFHGSMQWWQSNPAVKISWEPDFSTHGNNETPCCLVATPPQMGPDVDVAPGESFESFRAFDLLPDSTEDERRSLARRRMYRTVAPWTAENPFMFHKLGSDEQSVRDAINQASEVGFDMVIMSFGSGFNFETRDENYIARYKALADYGRSKGISLGGYSLLASRGAGTPEDNTQGPRAFWGVMPCLGSKWGNDYLETIRSFCDKAGLGAFENDGSYPGDRCAATNHPYHHGLEDSQWVMWKGITGLYKWCTGHGVYLNIPDWYFLAGGTKCAMHYAEPMYGRPREEQTVIERQYMFDGTFDKTASMGWTFVPLSSYRGGAESTIEPLDAHRDHYNERFADMIGYGVQACYRGPRLFDTEATKAIVKKWTSFYKTHREVLDGDIIHLRRPDGRDWDGIVHVNSRGKEKAMAFFYNPLADDITREIRVPLYYAGLTGSAKASIGGGAAQTVALDGRQTAVVTVKIPARGHQWVLFAE